MAIQHEYAYDEPYIPVDLFLEEMSLLFQEYTMKPASRPPGGRSLLFAEQRSSSISKFDNVPASTTPSSYRSILGAVASL
jgi:hypothetical protein